MYKDAATTVAIHPLLVGRWSPISFDPSYELDSPTILALAEAARWAPSCFGAEPWSFIFCLRQNEQDWAKALACLAEGNQVWAKNTSLLGFAIARENFEHNDKPNGHHLYDTGAATFSLVLQAETLGLRSHQMGGFSAEAVISNFAVPAGNTPIAAFAVGKQAEIADLADEKMRARESAPRTRQELAHKFFSGGWNQPLDA